MKVKCKLDEKTFDGNFEKDELIKKMEMILSGKEAKEKKS